MIHRDKNYREIKIGDSVHVPVIEGNVTFEFSGRVESFNPRDDYIIVEDQDGDCFCIEPELLEIEVGESENEGKDICYDCGMVQDYQTMQDVDNSFAIYCDKCHPVNNTANKVYRKIYEGSGEDISKVLPSYISFWREMNKLALDEES